MDRTVIDSVNALGEGNRYLPALRAWVGYKNDVIYMIATIDWPATESCRLSAVSSTPWMRSRASATSLCGCASALWLLAGRVCNAWPARSTFEPSHRCNGVWCFLSHFPVRECDDAMPWHHRRIPRPCVRRTRKRPLSISERSTYTSTDAR